MGLTSEVFITHPGPHHNLASVGAVWRLAGTTGPLSRRSRRWAAS